MHAARPGHRTLALALLAAVAVFGALSLGAKCYPPNTRVVVFMQGLYSSYDAGGTVETGIEPHTFQTLKQAFVAKGYDPAKLLDFSYAGGTVSADGVWHPKPYDCAITDRLADLNLQPLEQMLRDYRAKHPKAHFTLIGHSYGGYLAFIEAVRESQRADADKLDIDVVVTLDAPLSGVSADKKTVIDLSSSCVKTYEAGAELVEARQDPTTPATRATQATNIAHAGIRLATLGNNNDCLYALPKCIGSGIDDTSTQFIPQAAFTRAYDISSNPFLSHFAVLAYPPAVADAVTFIGAP